MPKIGNIAQDSSHKTPRRYPDDSKRNAIQLESLANDVRVGAEPLPVGVTQHSRRRHFVVVAGGKPAAEERLNPENGEVVVGHGVDQAAFFTMLEDDGLQSDVERNRAEAGEHAIVVAIIAIIGI